MLLFVADLLARRADTDRRLAGHAASRCSSCSASFAVLIMLQPNLGTTIILGVDRVRDAVRRAASPLQAAGAHRRRPAASLAIDGRHRSSRTAGAGCSASSTRGRTRRTPATRRSSRRSASPTAASSASASAQSRAKWGFLPVRPHRLHLRHHRRGARAASAPSSWSPCSSPSACSASAPRCGPPTASACCSPPASPRGSCVQAFVNIGAVVGVLPITGVPAAVRLLRRLVAAGARWPRRACCSTSPARRGLPPPRGDRAPSTRAPIAVHRRRRHRRPPAARARRRRGARRARPRSATTIHFVGSDRGLETDARARGRLPARPRCPGRGIQRRLTLRQRRAPSSASSAACSRASASSAGRDPQVVVVARRLRQRAPCIVGAILWRVPIVVTEQNARAGAANRLAGRFAKAAAVPFAEHRPAPRRRHRQPGARPRSCADRSSRDRDRGARRSSGLPADRAVVAVFSGSLGSPPDQRGRARPLGRSGRDRDDLAIHHVVGAPRLGRARRRRRPTLPAGGLVYQPVRYEDRMDAAARRGRPGA